MKTKKAKKPQSPWLRRAALTTPALTRNAVTARAEQIDSPRLLSKAEVLKITSVSAVTIWSWMRNGVFPRSRIVGGKSMRLSHEIAEWMAALPMRRLKGDDVPKERSKQ